jgi:hypothetical protein
MRHVNFIIIENGRETEIKKKVLKKIQFIWFILRALTIPTCLISDTELIKY